MKKSFLYFFLIFNFVSLNFVFSNENDNVLFGTELCNSVYDFLEQNNCDLQIHSLVNDGENEFPFNISFIKQNEFNNQNEDEKTLILSFEQEQVLQNKDLFTDILQFIKNNQFSFDILFFFSYGDFQLQPKKSAIFGTKSFLDNLVLDNEYFAFIFDLDNKKNQVITSSSKTSSPSFLILNAFSSFCDEGFVKDIPRLFVSQMFKMSFFQDKILDFYFEKNIPSVKFNFIKENGNSQKINKIIQNLLTNFESEFLESSEFVWDSHFLIFRFFGRLIFISETTTIIIIIFIMFFWIFLIVMILSLNIVKKQQSLIQIKKIWFILPLSFLILVFSFFLGKLFVVNCLSKGTDTFFIFKLFLFEFSLSCIFEAILFFILNFKIHLEEEKTIDFLLIIAFFVNQSIFILIDISLFPIFLSICTFSILSFNSKNKIIKFIFDFLIIIIHFPYVLTIINFSDVLLFKQFLIVNSNYLIFLPLILYPTFIFLFKRFYFSKIDISKHFFIFISIILFLTSISLIFGTIINNNRENKKLTTSLIKTSKEEIIFCDYFDENIFDDTIRTLKININENENELIQCDVQIFSKNKNPILYSNNSFQTIFENSSVFLIPNNPPKNMTFSYGTINEQSSIKITAIFSTTKINEFVLITKEFTIGEDNE